MQIATGPPDDQSSVAAKRVFANRASDFANRVRAMPGLRIYPVAGMAAVTLMTTAGAFGTLAIPLLVRLLFWTLLIGFNTAIWICWFAWRVRAQTDWWRAALLGMLVLNLPLPLEIAWIGRLLGLRMAENWLSPWTSAIVISVALLLVLTIAVRGAKPMTVPDYPKGLLWRNGFRDPEKIAAVGSEDHYCRVWSADGTSRLLHARFSELALELSCFDGAIVRRGHWVAANSVTSIQRHGRRWRVLLAHGQTVAVSSSAAAGLRVKGWI